MAAIFDIVKARLTGAGRTLPDPAWGMTAHTHSYWEFIYFVRGCGRVQIPQKTLHPHQYHLVVYPPGLPHEELTDPVNPEETVFFGVDVPGIPPRGAHLLLPDQHDELRWLVEHLYAEYLQHGASPLVSAYLQAFLLLVERAWTTGITFEHDAIDLVVQYLHAHYARQVSLDELAALAEMSANHLSHRFRARMTCSPMQYLQQLRMEEAKRLLLATDLPVQQVSTRVGYHDPLYFSRLMRQVTGFSPSSFRQNANRTDFSISPMISSIPSVSSTE